ncbi:hypothetical protein [Clostridium saccharoperbutylacetonicum]
MCKCVNYISKFEYTSSEEIVNYDNQFNFECYMSSDISKLPEKIQDLDAIKMISEISTKDTKYHYDVEKRNEIEFYRAYKNAIKRNIPLYEVKVLNLNFSLSNSKISKSNAVQASMLITKDKSEWILIFPCITQSIIEKECEEYTKISNELVKKEKISADVRDNLLNNLNEINEVERCTQSLIHEYGHILNWRIFNSINLEEEKEEVLIDCLSWFKEIGYVRNIVKRKLNLLRYPLDELISLLKESFAEDFRMGVCINSVNKYILPNTVCWIGDLYEPSNMEEGIEIVRNSIQQINSVNVNNINRTNSQNDVNRYEDAKKEYDLLKELNYEFVIPDDEEIDDEIDLYVKKCREKSIIKPNEKAKETKGNSVINNAEVSVTKVKKKYNGKTFIDKCLEGEALVEQIQIYKDLWKSSNLECELFEFLGLTEEEDNFLTENSSLIEFVLEARELNQSIEEYMMNIGENELVARAPSIQEANNIKNWLIERGKIV